MWRAGDVANWPTNVSVAAVVWVIVVSLVIFSRPVLAHASDMFCAIYRNNGKMRKADAYLSEPQHQAG